MKADIVIPTLDGMEFLPRVIGAIRAQDAPFDYTITCIDSESTDGTYEWLRWQPGIRLETTDDFQHGRTRNYGASLGSAEYIVFLTQDAIPADRHWLRNFALAMDGHPQAAGGFGRHEAHREHPGQVDNMVNFFRQFEDYPLCVSMDTDRARWDSGETYWRRFMHFYSDNNSCMRRSVWEEYPYPEVEFGEDQAWADMIIRAGYSKLYVPAACVYHSHNFTEEQKTERAATEREFFSAHFGYD
jgi:GT2 family glycosyltransferase